MDDVGEQVVVFESVVGVNPVVVDCEGASPDASLVLGCRVCSELSSKDIEDLFSHPSPFGKRCECEVVGVHLSETCKYILLCHAINKNIRHYSRSKKAQ